MANSQEHIDAAQQEPAIWAISYDGKTPYAIWFDGDGVLLDLEVKRQGGTTCKLPLYASPPAQRKPLTDDEIWREYRFLWPFHPAEERKLASDILIFARAIEAAHNIK